ncbi:MAG TPA: tRNA (adenosine(37)-N6)-threonylcarbamoyltransferase complex dimerization subunit type 1 TsaB [Chthonomonadaceae bacterium]|nr:tRNA (adenosine(37)-N6)-threonylcarbamoyltransferase complex dimerization subunit type 1 TsaB [Chthonomonadaceae bacterium]
MSAPAKPPEGLLLALETSGDVCGVAVQRGRQFLSEHRFRHGMHLSERLMGHIDAVLADAEATLDDVTAFAVGIGPGSFTGTRIGVMTAKTFAAVTGQPIVGVVGLAALAAEYAGLRDTLVTPILPCRAGVVYAGLFVVEGETPAPLMGPAALPLADLLVRIGAHAPRHLVFCGPAVPRYAAELRTGLQGHALTVSFGKASDPRAALIAHLAYQRLESGAAPDDPMTLVPLYISPPPITLPKTR